MIKGFKMIVKINMIPVVTVRLDFGCVAIPARPVRRAFIVPFGIQQSQTSN
jgi:hypothetical protein